MTKCHDQGNLWKKVSIHGLWLQRVRLTIMVGTLQEAGQHLAESKKTLIENIRGCWNLQAHSQWQIPSNKATPPSRTLSPTWDKYSNIRAFLCEPPHIVSWPHFNPSLLAICFLGSNWFPFLGSSALKTLLCFLRKWYLVEKVDEREDNYCLWV